MKALERSGKPFKGRNHHVGSAFAGLELLADDRNGSYVAKCLDDRFWLSPACRSNSSSCILLLTAGSGCGICGTSSKDHFYGSSVKNTYKISIWMHLGVFRIGNLTGWAMQDIMQWASAYAMPISLGVAETFNSVVSLVKGGHFLFYWWEPLDGANFKLYY